MSVGTTPVHLGSQGACGARSHFAAKKVALAAAFAALSLAPAASWSLGLGRLNVQSALGEPLRAEIDVTSITPEEAASLQSKMASPETYRAAGVDYNQVLGATSVALQKRADGRSVLRLSSDRAVTEPFVDAILDLSWSSGRLVREYTLLFDPPAPKSAQTPAVTSPAMDTPAPVPRAAAPSPSPAPVAQAPSAPAPAPVSKPKAAPVPAPVASKPPAPAPAPVKAAPAPAPMAAASAPAAGGQTVKVRSGDSLSQIAERTIKPGVSLDQMVVGLYRANPEAFQGNNMNRLKAGVVLQVPTAEKAQSVTPQEARQVIVAQSSDFSAYRQRLATGVAESVKPAQERQAKGKVEAEVHDRKQTAAPSPDKLTLSKGGMASSQPGVEDKLSKARAQQDTGTRVTELSRNLDELRKLKEQAASKAAAAKAEVKPEVKVPAPAAPASVAKAPVAPAPVAKPAPAPALVASAPAPAPKPEVKASAPAPVAPPAPAPVVASAPVPAAAPASVAAPAPASAPEPVASGAATAVANAASAASAAEPAPMVPTIPKPVQIPVEPAPADQPGFFQSVDPLMLAGAGVLVAGLAGAGLFLRSRRRPDSAETSFLESRLQPDSFFGASGGQRVDTRDASGGPSSMSYSLSQLDAIGDVDPVAEADVYLAYGRDLQAEEILKEALRSNPDRLAIRTKLLEVYAKRRDTKGYEQLAVHLFGLTGGEGEDWARAQEMGLGIDPDNQLYQPGGQPAANLMPEPEAYEPLGASTVPVSVMPAMAQQAVAAPEPVPEPDLDAGLDLDISAPAPLDFPDAPSIPSVPEPAPQAVAQAPALPDQGLDFDLPDLDAAAAPDEFPPVSFESSAPTEPVSLSELASEAASAPAPTPSSFDLGSISLDLDEPAAADEPLPVGEVGLPELDDAASDPMARKLDLAEEFRQIGDVDGARELLQEVIASTQDASLQSKARNMLDNLG
jgi:pilus assembly protein FimV